MAESYLDAPAESPVERVARLRDQELRLLAAATGDHLPVELAERVRELRRERELLACNPPAGAA